MLIGDPSRTRVLLAATGLFVLAGCAQRGPILSSRTSLGTLKAGLSHLEYENQQLRSKVAELESENLDIEDRLVQEEAVNGELSAKLDDARNLLAQSGYDVGGSSASTRREGAANNNSTPRALPAGQSSRKPRKPPFARIPGRIDSAPAGDDADAPTPRSRIPGPDSFGAQGWRDDDTRWLPVARGTNEPASRVR